MFNKALGIGHMRTWAHGPKMGCGINSSRLKWGCRWGRSRERTSRGDHRQEVVERMPLREEIIDPHFGLLYRLRPVHTGRNRLPRAQKYPEGLQSIVHTALGCYIAIKGHIHFAAIQGDMFPVW